jgi:hypothetical protein
MQRLEVSGAVRLIYGSLGVRGLMKSTRNFIQRSYVYELNYSFPIAIDFLSKENAAKITVFLR